MSRQTFFSQLNQFFDHIYVLTLHRATDRHQHIEKELSGLHYSFFFGKDKKTFDSNELKEKKIYDEQLAMQHDRYSRPMQSGPIGCSWSHRLIYEDMLYHQFKQVLILEDDVVVDEKTIDLWPVMINELPNNWSLFYLGFEGNEHVPTMSRVKQLYYHLLSSCKLIKYSHDTIRNLYPTKISPHVYTTGWHNCTHAYALKSEAARTLIDLQTPISFVADNLLAHAATNQQVKSYTLLPKLINQQYQVMDKKTHSFVNE